MKEEDELIKELTNALAHAGNASSFAYPTGAINDLIRKGSAFIRTKYPNWVPSAKFYTRKSRPEYE